VRVCGALADVEVLRDGACFALIGLLGNPLGDVGGGDRVWVAIRER
jgi:hypothetical protein